MNYNNEDWLGYICENILRQCIELCSLRCDGCKDSLKSSLLHVCCQLSLFQKLEAYFEEVRGTFLPNVSTYYAKFEKHLPHSKSLQKDQLIYVNAATNFLIQLKPEVLYFGRYINAHNQERITNAL